MRILLTITLSLIGVIALSGYSANAADCTCVTDASGDTLGRILKVSGDVRYTGANGFVPAPAGAGLVAGSRIIVGDDSSADITVGQSCRQTLPVGSEVTISLPADLGGRICVAEFV